jgi:hypothetical protein
MRAQLREIRNEQFPTDLYSEAQPEDQEERRNEGAVETAEGVVDTIDVTLEVADLTSSAASCLDAMPSCDFIGCDLGCL